MKIMKFCFVDYRHSQMTSFNPRYFLITMTNYPNLIMRTQQYQHPLDYKDPAQYERFLYNTLRFELEGSIRGYLLRTQRPYPINLVFDLSHIN